MTASLVAAQFRGPGHRNQSGLSSRQPGADLGWNDGNFNCDATVDAADLNLIGLHWQFGAPAGAVVRAARTPRAALAFIQGFEEVDLQQRIEGIEPSALKNNGPNSPKNDLDTGVRLRISRQRQDRIIRRTRLHKSSMVKTRLVDRFFEQHELAQQPHDSQEKKF